MSLWGLAREPFHSTGKLSISFAEVSRFESQPLERMLLSLCHPRVFLANNPKQKPISPNEDAVCRTHRMWELKEWIVLGMACKMLADTGLNLAQATRNCCVVALEGKCWWFQGNFHYRWDVATLCNAVTDASVEASLHGVLESHKDLFSTDYVQTWRRLSAWACTCPWQVCLGGNGATEIEIATGPNSSAL